MTIAHIECVILLWKKKTSQAREDFKQIILSHSRPGHTIRDHGGSMAFELHEVSANSRFKIVTEGFPWH